MQRLQPLSMNRLVRKMQAVRARITQFKERKTGSFQSGGTRSYRQFPQYAPKLHNDLRLITLPTNQLREIDYQGRFVSRLKLGCPG